MKNLKKVLLALLILFTVVTVNVFAYNMNVRVIVDGKIIESKDLVEDKEKTGFISNNRTHVPLGLIGENLDCNVNYNAENKDIDISREDLNIKMNVNSSDFTVDGENKTMDVKPIIYNNRTYIPIRYIGEAFGKEVKWDESSRTCIIGDKGDIDLENLKEQSEKTDEDYEVYTFGYPKVTIKIPMEIMKEIKVEKNYFHNGISLYEAISYDDDEKQNGFLFTIFQATKDDYLLEDEHFGVDKVLDIEGESYLAVDYIRYQDMIDYYKPLTETPHYKELLNKLKEEIIFTQDKYPEELDKYKIYSFGDPKVTVKVPKDLAKDLDLVLRDIVMNDVYDRGIKIYKRKENYSLNTLYLGIQQFEDPKLADASMKQKILDKTGGVYTIITETKDIGSGEDPIFDRLKDEIIVEVQK